MAKNYSKMAGVASRKAPHAQTVQARPDQIQNAAGGFVFAVDKLEQLRRFLILGSAGGTYYISERKLTKDNMDNIVELFKTTEGGKAAVDEIVKISHAGRAPKNDPALFALALAASCDNAEVRSYALSNLSKVARIGTHLFNFVTFIDGMRGWGHSLHKGIASWYTDRDVKNLAYQVCKYPQRKVEGELPWSHRDILRKLRLKADGDLNTLFKYIVEGKDHREVESRNPVTKAVSKRWVGFTDSEWNALKTHDALKYVWAHEAAKAATTSDDVLPLIEQYGITRESIPNNLFADGKVWKKMIENGMPMTAMLRNIRNMTKAGVLAPLSSETKKVCELLRNEDVLHKARIHPLNVLAAMIAYNPSFGGDVGGYGFYGIEKPDYTPVPAIVDAMEDAFYKSFQNVEPTGKNILLAVDVSGSMTSPMSNGIKGMSCCMGAAAMAMVFARTEKNYHIMGFADELRDLKITANDKLDTAMRKAQMSNWGGTDCAIACKVATRNKWDVDAFVIMSDMETWAGETHVFEALNKYRSQQNKPNAKMIAVGMTSSNSTVADPTDKNSLNIVGFDAAAPQIMCDFIGDRFGTAKPKHDED